ncbi:unnamed protein product [Gongylonema pulchrum]|uniref:MMS19 nucleotide excision repair protein n=1 Tax=Gongylonema pulchrum TaxID=637853 RepID=A0A183DUD2_9BILA|nr:unnamed protein product [Gongylonema pulchrum]
MYILGYGYSGFAANEALGVLQMVLEEDFLFQNLQCSAVCLAKLKNVSLEKVSETLLDSDAHVTDKPLNHHARSKILATGIYLLYADGRHIEDLLPALLKVYSNLPHLKWIDDGALNRQDKIPVQEQFALCFNTILSELAAKYANVRDRIVSAQIELLSITADIIIEICGEAQPTFQTKLYLMRVLCFIIGLFRAFGRYSNDKEHPLISAIYPPPFTIGKADGVNSQPAELDRVAYMINFKVERLLRKPILDIMDVYAADVYMAGQVRRFPYKTISECLSLVCVTAARDACAPYDMLKAEKTLPQKFARELFIVFSFIVNSEVGGFCILFDSLPIFTLVAAFQCSFDFFMTVLSNFLS